MHRIAALIAATALSGAALADDLSACKDAPPKSIELVICKSPMLGALDAELNRVYALAISSAKPDHVTEMLLRA